MDDLKNSETMTDSIFFNLICREGTPKIIDSYLKLHNVDEYTIGTGFDNGCMFNIDNAKYLLIGDGDKYYLANIKHRYKTQLLLQNSLYY